MDRLVTDYANPAHQIAGGRLTPRTNLVSTVLTENIAHAITITDNDRLRPSIKKYGRVKNYRNSNFREQKQDIRLPLLDNCSSLAQEAALNPTVDVSHRNSAQYPLVKRFHAFRPRNLALGGPYEEHLTYRREVLGYLYTASRCDICLAISTVYTPVAVRVAGFRLCTDCVAKWTINLDDKSGDVIEYVKQYFPLLRSDDDGWDPDIHFPHGFISGRVLLPLLDHAVRQQLGIDYETAQAKDAYLGRLRRFNSKETNFDADCRKIRLLVMEAAERLYRSNSPRFGNLGVRVEYWSKAFLPASRLREVLFAPEALDQDALLFPVPSDTKYPTDQVLIQIESAFYAKLALRNADKIQDMALSMVKGLLRNPNKSTRLAQLATEYHINRLLPTFTVEGLKEARDKISSNPRQNAPHRTPQSPQYTRSVNSLLAKLGLEPDNSTQQLQVDGAGQHAAIKTLPRLLESACLLCPASGLLAGRGINRVLEHVRFSHQSLFWGDSVKGSREEHFKLIG